MEGPGGFGGRGVVSSYATRGGQRKPIGPYMPTGVVNEGAPPDEEKVGVTANFLPLILTRIQSYYKQLIVNFIEHFLLYNRKFLTAIS